MHSSLSKDSSKIDYFLRITIHYFWLAIKVFLIPLAIYVAYFLYGAYHSLGGFSKQAEAIRRFAEVVMLEKLRQENIVLDKQKIAMGLSGISSPDSCNFWTFDSLRFNCRVVSIAVRDFNEIQKNEIIYLVNHVASPLARPCDNLHLMPAKEQVQIGLDLGCGKKRMIYRMEVQARASRSVETTPGGGGYYINKLILSTVFQGEI